MYVSFLFILPVAVNGSVVALNIWFYFVNDV